MIPLDQIRLTVLEEQNARKFLSQEQYEEFLAIPLEQREKQLEDILTKPICQFTAVNELYFRSRWAEFIGALYGNEPIWLLEVASGDTDMIPQALSRCNPQSTYIAANMNRLLTESLIRKTKELDLVFKLVDDDAANITQYVGQETVDLIAFQHGVNDVLQAILCNEYQVDTIYSDWMEVLPEMIRILQKEIKQNTFEAKVKEPFVQLIKNLSLTLKPGGVIAMNHYQFQLDLDWGYPPNLFENMLPIVRSWFQNQEGYTEFTIDGYDPQWWMFLKKTN